MALIGKELMLLWPLLILERIQACSTVERLFHKMYVLKKLFFEKNHFLKKKTMSIASRTVLSARKTL